ncbi:hypothetical protein ND861_08440 [Leptospira sp. 2 VSF19]|uniref:Uncharacterized protein n=1 Tax=Leptospira soteropolitanensis TaxID=2950025 RepID=A0AAW5VHL1_9LEPT|nr:hypothetical protein [Leptospira soteropolitanensis]MCW7493024.1 hypothetical protein [Leptospira soteropolitanensis]MCW7500259.1 hypothetical protein [Leptospira soteropolitanensis]MCW7522510.1 hypothetical protein [Leptospira soteropolitanensis]MCW7526366.1 hypothetical protein [Leptospira soteropolitanensis]MCW7529522.1 hypothetical protein [Leptospira soteropolitanensis]
MRFLDFLTPVPFFIFLFLCSVILSYKFRNLKTDVIPNPIPSVGTSETSQWEVAVVAPDGRIYTIPADSDNFIVFDPDNFVSATYNSGISGSNKWGDAVLSPNGKMYTIPHTND